MTNLFFRQGRVRDAAPLWHIWYSRGAAPLHAPSEKNIHTRKEYLTVPKRL